MDQKQILAGKKFVTFEPYTTKNIIIGSYNRARPCKRRKTQTHRKKSGEFTQGKFKNINWGPKEP